MRGHISIQTSAIDLHIDRGITHFYPRSPFVKQFLQASAGSNWCTNNPDCEGKSQISAVFCGAIQDSGLPMGILLDDANHSSDHALMLTLAQEQLTVLASLALEIGSTSGTLNEKMEPINAFCAKAMHALPPTVSFAVVALYQEGSALRAMCFSIGNTMVALDDGKCVRTVLAGRTLPMSAPLDQLEIADFQILPGQRVLPLTKHVYHLLPQETIDLQDSDGRVVKCTRLRETVLSSGQSLEAIMKQAHHTVSDTFQKRSIAETVELGGDTLCAAFIAPTLQQQLQLRAWVNTRIHHDAIDHALHNLIEGNEENPLNALPTDQCLEVLLTQLSEPARARADIQTQLLNALSHKSIHCLDLHGFHCVTNDILRTLLRSINQKTTLLALDISGCNALTASVFESIEKYAPQLLALQANGLTHLDTIQTTRLKNPRQFPELRVLSLSHSPQLHLIKLTAPQLHTIDLDVCPQLNSVNVFIQSNTVNVARNPTTPSMQSMDEVMVVTERHLIDPAFLFRLATQIKRNPVLQAVHMQHCAIPADGLAALLRNFALSFQCLDLSHSFLDTVTMATLADALRKNTTTVKNLSLSQCRLSIHNSTQIIRALTDNVYVTHLNLSGNPVEDDFLKTIIEVLQVNYLLTDINVDTDRCSEEFIENMLTLLDKNKGRRSNANVLTQGIRALTGIHNPKNYASARTCLEQVLRDGDSFLAGKARHYLSILEEAEQKDISWQQVQLINQQVETLKKLRTIQFIDMASKYQVFYLLAEYYQETHTGLYALPETHPLRLEHMPTVSEAGITLTNLDEATVAVHFNRLTDLRSHQYDEIYRRLSERLLQLIRSLLEHPMLLRNERDDLYLLRKKVANATAQQQYHALKKEINGRNASDRTHFLRQYIATMNDFIEKETVFLDDEHRKMDLTSFNLTHMDFSNLDLRHVIFEHKEHIAPDAKNLTGLCVKNALVTPTQFVYVRGINALIDLDPEIRDALEEALVTVLQGTMHDMIEQLQFNSTLLQDIPMLDALVCHDQMPNLSHLGTRTLENVIYFALISTLINPLEYPHPASPMVLSSNSHNFYERSSEEQWTLLQQLLAARNYQLPSDLVAFVQFQKVSLIQARISALSNHIHDIELRVAELSPNKQERVQDTLATLKSMRKQLKSDGKRLLVTLEARHIQSSLLNLYADPDITTPLTPIERLNNVVNAVRGRLTPLDLRTTDLNGINAKEFHTLDFTDAIVLLTPEQNDRLTADQKTQSCTTLFHSIKKGDIDTVKTIVEMGVDINRVDGVGRNALMTACFMETDTDTTTPKQLAILRHLIEHGANPNQKTTAGWRIIESVCRLQPPPIALVNTLIELGAILDFFSAIYLGDLDRIQWLTNDLDEDTKRQLVNQPDGEGQYPLHIAVTRNHLGLIEWLYKHGAAINTKTQHGKTTLMLACERGVIETVEWLIRHDALQHELDNGQSAVRVAVERKHRDVADIMIAAGARVDLYTAIALNDTAQIKTIIGEHYNAEDDNGNTPLGIACYVGNHDVVQWLLDHDVNPNSGIYHRYAALTIAVKENQKAIVKTLIAAGADTNTRLQYKAPPLWLATANNQYSMVQLLLCYPQTVGQPPVDINIQHNERTPLLVAVQDNRFEIARLLIQHNADTTCCDVLGNTLLHIAAEHHAISMMKILLSASTQWCNQAGKTPLDIARETHGTAAIAFLERWSINIKQPQDEKRPRTEITTREAGLFRASNVQQPPAHSIQATSDIPLETLG